MALSPGYLLVAGGGGVFLYAAITGKTVTGALRAIATGQNPNTAPDAGLGLLNVDPSKFPGGTPGAGGPSGAGVSVSGSQIDADAMKYVGHKYVFGGPSNVNGGWDCSSFASWVLGHDLGLMIPRLGGGASITWASGTGNGSTHGPVASDYKNWSGASNISRSQVQPGDLLCWDTHVGFAHDSQHMISAYDTASGTLVTGIDGAGPSGETLVCRRLTTAVTGAGGAANAGAAVGANDSMVNGTIIYRYFRANGFNPMQAAGAIASMWGESSWNPESAGTGGNGLIGWTPPLPGIITGNAAADMQKQLPLILQFIAANGDQSAVNMMASAGSVTAAAQIWDHQVERAGINDVHPQGVASAVAIAKAVDNVNLPI